MSSQQHLLSPRQGCPSDWQLIGNGLCRALPCPTRRSRRRSDSWWCMQPRWRAFDASTRWLIPTKTLHTIQRQMSELATLNLELSTAPALKVTSSFIDIIALILVYHISITAYPMKGRGWLPSRGLSADSYGAPSPR